MAYVATSGNYSCAAYSIGKIGKYGDPIGENEKYKETKKFETTEQGLSVAEFCNRILYPTSQPLGNSIDMPFEKLMEEISGNATMNKKLCTIIINQTQFDAKSNYWPNEFKRWGFKLIHKTKNNIGQVNYMFKRDPVEVPMTEEDKKWA